VNFSFEFGLKVRHGVEDPVSQRTLVDIFDEKWIVEEEEKEIGEEISKVSSMNMM